MTDYHVKQLAPNHASHIEHFNSKKLATMLSDEIEYIKEHDINIRQSIGEAVPTEVFSNIAKNIKKALNDKCKTR